MNPPGAPSNETWAPSGAGTTEEAEILHMDMRSVSLGMGKFFYGHQKVPPAHSPKTGEWGFTAKDQHRLAGEDSDPTGASSYLLHRGTPVSTSSRSRCHLPPPWGQSPGWAWLQELADSGAERCHHHQPGRGWRGESPGWWESSIGAAGPGTNHVGGGVCSPAGFRGPRGILHFAPEETQISPSPGQGPRRMDVELRQHPCNARPPAEMLTGVPWCLSWWG